MSLLQAVKSHYDTLAGQYNARWPAYNQSQIDWIISKWPHAQRPQSLLDLGCGTGLALSQLGNLLPHLDLLGVDISDGMLGEAQKRCSKALFFKGDIEDTRFIDGLPKSDVVMSLSVLHHLSDMPLYLKSLRAAAKPGGTVILSDFAIDGLSMFLADKYFTYCQRHYYKGYSSKALFKEIYQSPYFILRHFEVIHPDDFWSIQMYCLETI